MAATPKYQSQSGIVTNKTIASAYDKTFDEIRVKVENSSKKELERFFMVDDTNLETYKEGEVYNTLEVPHRNEETDRVPILTPLEGYAKSFTNVLRRSGILVTERAIRAQKTKVITQMMTGLPASADKLVNLAHAKMFADGFATETTGDGSYVFATDHYYEDPAFGQWSNLSATSDAFSTSSYFAAWLNMQTRKDAKGLSSFMTPGEVLYPAAIHEAIMKVHGSTLYPQNSLNAKMPELFGAFEPVLGHWLTNTTAWYVHASGVSDMDKGFRFIYEYRPTYKPLSDPMNPDIIMGKMLKMSFSYGALHSKDWYANNGA